MISPGPFCFIISIFFNYILFESFDDKCIYANSESGSDPIWHLYPLISKKEEIGKNSHSFQMDLTSLFSSN